MRAAANMRYPVYTIDRCITPLGLQRRFRREIENMIIVLLVELEPRRLRLIIVVVCCPCHLVCC